MKKQASVVTEIGVFSTVIGGVLAILAALAYFKIDHNAPKFFGLDRHLTFGAAIGVAAVCNLIAGIINLAFRKSFSVMLCIISGFTIPVVYFGLVGVHVNLTIAIIVAIPVLLFVRGKLAFEELDQTDH